MNHRGLVLPFIMILFSVVLAQQPHCSSPVKPRHGGFHTTKQDFSVDTVVAFYCSPGYSLVGVRTIICVNGGFHAYWTGETPKCVRQGPTSCPKPVHPQHGISMYKADLAVGSIVVYECLEGYKIVGVTKRTCLPSGHWSDKAPTCEVIHCSDPGVPINGHRVMEDTGIGAVATYYCNPGYRLVGEASIVCLNIGHWSRAKPLCRKIEVDCGQPEAPSSGGVTVDGTTAVYYCKEGFALSGEAQRRCMPDGRWSGFVPSCRIVDCGDPGIPRNGLRDISSTLFRSIVEYSCYNGYHLIGDNVRFCMASGKWSGFLPTCRLVNCGDPGTPVNGRREVSSTTFRSAVFYSCNDGYSIVGSEIRVCTASGEWSDFIPSCKRTIIGCGNPGVPDNGRSNYHDNKIGSVVTHSCNTGFVLKGDQLRRCLPTGSWSGSLPSCQPTDCGDPGTPRDGEKSLSGTTFGSVAVYFCDNGFILKGNPLRRCQQNGKWSGSIPKCQIIDCGFPESPVGGYVEVTTTTFSSDAIYKCNTGLVLIGDNIRRCESTKEWSGTVPKCDSVKCRDPGIPANGIRRLTDGTNAGSVVNYGCKKGYVLEGSSSRVCRSNGAWSTPLPRCKALQCGDPGAPINGRKIVTTRTIGSEVLFTCDNGYSLSGHSVRTCQPDQSWSGTVPLCIKVDCGDPKSVANGVKIFSKTEFNSVVEYSCDINYVLSGESLRVCQADGTWSGSLPNCEPKDSAMCGDPGIPEYGQRVVTSNLVTSVVKFSCNHGYYMVGDKQRTCLPTGQWSGSIPRCELIDCGTPSQPRNGVVIGNDFTFGATVEYHCINGFVLVGLKTRTCQEDGSWSGDMPLCKENPAVQCEDPGVPDNGRRIGNTFAIGSIVYFQCSDGYELVGEKSIQCLPGNVWSAHGPFCRIITDTCNGDGIEVFDSCQRKCTCREGFTTECCRLRRDWAAMSLADRRQYIDAVIRVSTDPVYKPRYDSLITLYHQLANSIVHNSDPAVSQFIPWHRYFLIEYENLLRQISCNITVPYWDWTGLPKNPYVADVFDIGSGFGDSARFSDSCVNIGPFSFDKWALPETIGGGCLKREYQFRTFPTRDSIERDLLPYPASDFFIVHQSLQLAIHNLVRCTIGGTMCTPGDAAADPLYILHLSKIDSIYSRWQGLKMGRQLIRYPEDYTLLAGADNLVVAELSNNQQLPYGISVCYDAPFKLKNYQPAKRSVTTPCTEPAEMDSFGLSNRETEIIHKMCE